MVSYIIPAVLGNHSTGVFVLQVSTSARWILEDASGNQKGCFQLPVVIKSPTKQTRRQRLQY